MRTLIPACALALVVGVGVHAQDSTVKSQTRVKTDDAKTVVMKGCLHPGYAADGFILTGAVATTGKDLKSDSKTKIDVDKDEKTVRSKSQTEIEHGEHSVGTSGLASSYAVSGRAGVDLASHVNEEVEIAAVLIAAKGKGDDEAKIKVQDRTEVEREHAPDTKSQSNSKIEVPRGALPQLMAMSVKTIGSSCENR
jgi:hypothetical protein